MRPTETKQRHGLTSTRVMVATAASTILVETTENKKVFVTALWIYNDHGAPNTITLAGYDATTSATLLEYGLPAGNGIAMNAGAGEPILVTASGHGLAGSWDTDTSPVCITYYID